MTVEEVRNRAAAISRLVRDDEAAHAAEDRLHEDVLYAIAEGASNSAELAREALLTRLLLFGRCYG